jgi:hypothetical protein
MSLTLCAKYWTSLEPNSGNLPLCARFQNIHAETFDVLFTGGPAVIQFAMEKFDYQGLGGLARQGGSNLCSSTVDHHGEHGWHEREGLPRGWRKRSSIKFAPPALLQHANSPRPEVSTSNSSSPHAY